MVEEEEEELKEDDDKEEEKEEKRLKKMSTEEKESSSVSKVHPFRRVHRSFLSSLVVNPQRGNPFFCCSQICSFLKKNHPPRKTNSIFVLVVAIVSASTAGVIFKILEGEPLCNNNTNNKGGEKGEKEEKVAALLASSRVTATALVQLPIFLCSLLFRSSSSSSSSSPKKKTLRGEERKRTRTTIRDENNEEDARYLRENLHVFVLSGFFLSLHFYFWMNGLVRTSLSHSLLFVTSSPIAYVCLTAMTFRSEKVQKVIVWVVSKKNRQQQQQKKNTVGDEDNNETRETGANGGEIELHEYNVEEGKKEEEEEENENVNDDDDDDDDEFTELYTVPPSSSVSSSSSSILRFKDVSSFEVIGAIIGFVGSCIIAFDATNKNGSSNSSSSSSSSSSRQRNDRPSLKGDVLSLLSAILVCGYIAIGAKIRGDRPSMPIFVYSFPIVASAAIFLQIVVVLTCAFDDDGGFKPTVFLESYRWMRFWDPAVGQKTCFLVFFLAVVPGTLGHSGFFVAMKHLSSLTVTFALSFEPIIGSAIGYLLSVSSIPGPATFVGGFVLLVGVYCCNL